MPAQKIPWEMRPNETIEEHNAFCLVVDTAFGDLNEAWRRFRFTESDRSNPENEASPAPAQWHEWASRNEWASRREACLEEQARLAAVQREAETGEGLSWTGERRQDYQELLAIFKLLRTSLLELLASSGCVEVRTKIVTRLANGWSTVEHVSKPLESLREAGKIRRELKLTEAAVPQDANKQDLFLDLDTQTLPFGKPDEKIIYRFDPQTRKSVATTQTELRNRIRRAQDEHHLEIEGLKKHR